MLGIEPTTGGSGSKYANHCALMPPHTHCMFGIQSHLTHGGVVQGIEVSRPNRASVWDPFDFFVAGFQKRDSNPRLSELDLFVLAAF